MYTEEDDIAKVIEACAFFITELGKAFYHTVPEDKTGNQFHITLKHALQPLPEDLDPRQQEVVRILHEILSRRQAPPESQSERQLMSKMLQDIYFGQSQS